jgi:hypothetical protein
MSDPSLQRFVASPILQRFVASRIHQRSVASAIRRSEICRFSDSSLQAPTSLMHLMQFLGRVALYVDCVDGSEWEYSVVQRKRPLATIGYWTAS